MHRFWPRHIRPILDTARPRRVLQVGAENDALTEHVLSYCRAAGARADIIEPSPGPRFDDVRAPYRAEDCTHHPLRALEAIPVIEPADVALIDGDHNWYTVYKELSLIFARAAEAHAPPPVTLVSASAWPYGRRDSYRAPEELDVVDRHPYAYRGILPGHCDLDEQGLNGDRANALHEGGPRNGVLTAVEDFIGSSSIQIQLFTLPFFNGLAILVPQARMDATLQGVIESFFTAEAAMQNLIALEESCAVTQAALSQAQSQLARRSDALKRARALLAEQASEIERLRAKR